MNQNQITLVLPSGFTRDQATDIVCSAYQYTGFTTENLAPDVVLEKDWIVVEENTEPGDTEETPIVTSREVKKPITKEAFAQSIFGGFAIDFFAECMHTVQTRHIDQAKAAAEEAVKAQLPNIDVSGGYVI